MDSDWLIARLKTELAAGPAEDLLGKNGMIRGKTIGGGEELGGDWNMQMDGVEVY